MNVQAGDEIQPADDADTRCYGSVFVDSSVETKLSPPPRRDAEPRFVAVVSEYRANPVVSRRGYLLITDSKDPEESTAVKRWVVSSIHHSIRHPLVLYSPSLYSAIIGDAQAIFGILSCLTMIVAARRCQHNLTIQSSSPRKISTLHSGFVQHASRLGPASQDSKTTLIYCAMPCTGGTSSVHLLVRQRVGQR